MGSKNIKLKNKEDRTRATQITPIYADKEGHIVVHPWDVV